MANHPAGMLCPIDQTVLVMSERQGIEIDYCPTCRGVWLDRGELDKIIERSGTAEAPAAPAPAPRQQQPDHWQPRANSGDYDRERDRDRDYDHGRGHKRRKSWLEDIFD